MIEYGLGFFYHLSSFKALLYARSSFGAPVMISWRVFGVFQVTPTVIFPHFTKVISKTILLSDGMVLYSNFELVMKGGYLLQVHGYVHVNPVIHRSASSGVVDRCQKAFQVTPFYPT